MGCLERPCLQAVAFADAIVTHQRFVHLFFCCSDLFVHLQLVDTECVKLGRLKAIKFRWQWDLKDFGARFRKYTVEKYAVVLPDTTTVAMDDAAWQNWAAGGQLPMRVGWDVWLMLAKTPGKPCNCNAPVQLPWPHSGSAQCTCAIYDGELVSTLTRNTSANAATASSTMHQCMAT